MPGETLVGEYGDMPIEMLLKKQELSCVYENPHMVEQYHRATLKDLRPDKPFFESDQNRGGTDENGKQLGNNLSKQFLDFRDSGFRNKQGAEPHLPDGTFLDFQGTEKDLRGVAMEPNMRKYVDQEMSRASLINFKNDMDESVPSAGVNPWTMNSNIRQSQDITKNYLKIFETSKDSFSTASAAPMEIKMRNNIPIISSEIEDPKQILNRNVINVTNSLSNDTSIGFRRTTDHEFRVAQYGRSNISATTNGDIHKNRAKTRIDHDTIVSMKDLNVNKSLALKMIDLSKLKYDAHFTGMHGINWGDTKLSRGTKGKLHENDMAGMQVRQSDPSQLQASHTTINGDATTKSGSMLVKRDAPTINKTKINTTIFEIMAASNKKATQAQIDNLRQSIENSASDTNLYQSAVNTKQKNPSEDYVKNLWDSQAAYKKGDSKIVESYKSNLNKKAGHSMANLGNITMLNDSRNTTQRRGRFDAVRDEHDRSQMDHDYGRDDDRSKLIGGGLGSKYMMGHMVRDSTHNNINDI